MFVQAGENEKASCRLQLQCSLDAVAKRNSLSCIFNSAFIVHKSFISRFQNIKSFTLLLFSEVFGIG